VRVKDEARHFCGVLRNRIVKTAEKITFFRLLKKGQMQGARNPEE